MSTTVSYIIGRADEDRHNITELNDNIKMYGIYDGHTGKRVANYLQDNLPSRITSALLGTDFNDEEAMKEMLTKVFINLDAEIHDLNYEGGSTATIALQKNNKLYIANVADSRTIIYNSEGKVLLETIDHDCDNSLEVVRLVKLNATIYNKRVNGTLMVTRAFGDFELKRLCDSQDYNPRGWVSVVPDIYVFNIEQSNLTLLLASDGLWAGQYEDSSIAAKMALTKDDAEEIAFEGRKNYPYPDYLKDDITVIMIKL